MGFTIPYTKKLQGCIWQHEVVVLIESDATHNFLSLQFVEPLGLTIKGAQEKGVMLGNNGFDKSVGTYWYKIFRVGQYFRCHIWC